MVTFDSVVVHRQWHILICWATRRTGPYSTYPTPVEIGKQRVTAPGWISSSRFAGWRPEQSQKGRLLLQPISNFQFVLLSHWRFLLPATGFWQDLWDADGWRNCGGGLSIWTLCGKDKHPELLWSQLVRFLRLTFAFIRDILDFASSANTACLLLRNLQLNRLTSDMSEKKISALLGF